MADVLQVLVDGEVHTETRLSHVTTAVVTQLVKDWTDSDGKTCVIEVRNVTTGLFSRTTLEVGKY